jgi:hypothetical protein
MKEATRRGVCVNPDNEFKGTGTDRTALKAQFEGVPVQQQ